MKKKTSKFLAMLVVLVMALSPMALFANESTHPDDWDGTQNQISIRKLLRMPAGTLTPSSNFIFDIVLYEINGVRIGTPVAGSRAPGTFPPIPDPSYTGDPGDAPLIPNPDPTSYIPGAYTPGPILEMPVQPRIGTANGDGRGYVQIPLTQTANPAQPINPAIANDMADIARAYPNWPATTTGMVVDNSNVFATDNINLNLANVTWPSAGVFVFRITERHNTNALLDSNNYTMLQYSETAYYLYVYVANQTPGPGTEVFGVVAQEVRRGSSGDCLTPNPTLVNVGTESVPIMEYRDCGQHPHICDNCLREKLYGDMLFGNVFVYTPEDPFDPGNRPWEPNVPDGDAPLYVGKNVTGNLGSITNYFDFNINLTVPALMTQNQYRYHYVWMREPGFTVACDCDYDDDPGDDCQCGYTFVLLRYLDGDDEYVVVFERQTHLYAYIVDQAGVRVAPPALTSATQNNVAATLLCPTHGSTGRIRMPINASPTPTNYTADLNFSLRHGQRLVFVQLPTGTTYTVTEFYLADYTQRASKIIGAPPAVISPEVDGFVSGGTGNVDLTVDGIVSQGTDSGNIVQENAVIVENHRQSFEPMGVFLDNLPFIGLIVLAVGALTGFVVLKVRKSKRLEVVYQ